MSISRSVQFSLYTSISVLAVFAAAVPAHAQEPQSDSEQVASGDGATEGDVIIVTGSRIARPRDFTSPAPLVTIGADRLQQSGSTNLTDILTGYPALVGSTTSGDTSGDDAGIGGAGLNLLNLRNLGTQRTLSWLMDDAMWRARPVTRPSISTRSPATWSSGSRLSPAVHRRSMVLMPLPASSTSS